MPAFGDIDLKAGRGGGGGIDCIDGLCPDIGDDGTAASRSSSVEGLRDSTIMTLSGLGSGSDSSIIWIMTDSACGDFTSASTGEGDV